MVTLILLLREWPLTLVFGLGLPLSSQVQSAGISKESVCIGVQWENFTLRITRIRYAFAEEKCPRIKIVSEG